MQASDIPAEPAAEPQAGLPAEPQTAPAPAPKPRRNWVWPLLLTFGFVLLALGEAALWERAQVQTAWDAQLPGLQAQLSALQEQTAKVQPAPNSASADADAALKLADLAAQLNALQAQAAADHGALSTLQASSVDLTKLTARIQLLNQLESARMALDAGQPLGDIANAPPALARFAEQPAPTAAQLRLDFPAAARAAEAASIAGNATGNFWSRVLARLESLVTVSAGTHVLLGPPAAGVIGQAQALLEAGDLAGAVAVLDTLSPDTQAAMAGWLDQARALLAARAALIGMAGQG